MLKLNSVNTLTFDVLKCVHVSQKGCMLVCNNVYSKTWIYKQSGKVVYCKLKVHGEGIMSHNFPCSPQGGKLSQ